MRVLCCSFLLLVSCSNDAEVFVADMSNEFESDASTGDLVEDLDMESDALIPCRRDTDCPRGSSCNIDVCLALRGCSFNGTPDKGCYYDHGEDFNEGYFTAPECQYSEECTDPNEPNCIAQVCSRLTPCEQDEMCEEGQRCRDGVYCK